MAAVFLVVNDGVAATPELFCQFRVKFLDRLNFL